MISGRWGKPAEVLLDLVVEPDGVVRGVVNPGRENAPIRSGRFDAASGAVHLEGEVVDEDGSAVPYEIRGHLDGRTLRLTYRFGDDQGRVDPVRVEEYRPPPPTLGDRIRPWLAPALRRYNGLFRPRGASNRRRLEARGESPDDLVLRDAVDADVEALAELHVATWNATYRTSRGPSVATRRHQWTEALGKPRRRDFVLVLQDASGRLVGFVWGRPHRGDFDGELSKIYLRWEYHGLGIGRRLLQASARRFLDGGMGSFVLFADIANPTVGFFDHMGGERLLDEHGRFHGGFVWRDVRTLLTTEIDG